MIKLLLLAFSGLKFGKILLTGGTMLLSIAVYAQLWGWPFAAGFVVLLLLHEMGHFLAAKQRGLAVSAPAFIPFVGAVIQMRAQPVSVETEAYVAYAGPFVGTLASFVVYFWGRESGSGLLLALAYSGFVLNLFNLLPISPLDGGRITAIVSPKLWLVGVPLLAALFVYQPSPVLVLVALIAVPQALRAWRMEMSAPGVAAYYATDANTRLEYAALYLGLVVLLGLMTYQMHQELAAYR